MLKMAELPANVFPVIDVQCGWKVKRNLDLTVFLTRSITYDYESFILFISVRPERSGASCPIVQCGPVVCFLELFSRIKPGV
jgi:hypothetical protein